ncbi:MFS transporter [Deinococcus hopiensis]|uniref:Predicted arabinose efflux permease, MFS family n=1 Tax=Deinococcus hopiensis KR-140 TaxID=695939 RepID=A0A1W1UQF3_9DEIO|nr:MFS transporter [Deinococcus hopiensis]SMB83327.1 Predicted arabinose efflux permease, MFS family [Deinococcus hopiensis KR-140]
MFSLLRDRRILILWIGESINSFGSGLTFIALAWFLYRLYPDSPTRSGSVIGVWTAAMLLGTVSLASFTDIWDRRITLQVANGLSALWISLIPLLYAQDLLSFPVLFAVAALSGFTGSVIFPAQQASLPTFVPPNRLQGIQALFNLTWTTSGLLAPISAGFLVASVGAPAVMWVNAASFAAALAAYSLVRFPAVTRPGDSGQGLAAWWARTRFGFAFVLARPALWATLLGLASVNFAMEPYTAVFLPRIADRLMTGVDLPAALSWVSTENRGALGVGLLGSVLALAELGMVIWMGRRVSHHPLNWIVLGCAGPALCIVGVAYAPALWVALILALLMGLCFGPLNVMVGTLFARLTPEEVRGRVYSARILVGQGLRPVGVSLAALLIGVAGLAPAVALLGVFAALLTLAGYLRARGGEAGEGRSAGGR